MQTFPGRSPEFGDPVGDPGSDGLRIPAPEDAIERGDGLFEAMAVFFIEVAGLARQAAGRVGNLVACPFHLEEECSKRVRLGPGGSTFSFWRALKIRSSHCCRIPCQWARSCT